MVQFLNMEPDQLIFDLATEAGALFDMTLRRKEGGTRGQGGRLSAPTTRSYPCSGFFSQDSRRYQGFLTEEDAGVIVILGASLPTGIEPDTEDEILFDQRVYRVTNIRTDPAKARHLCAVE